MRDKVKRAAETRAYYRKHREEVLARAKARRLRDVRKIKADKRAYYLKNCERIKAQSMARYLKNRAANGITPRRFWRDVPAAVLRKEAVARAKAWRLANPEKARALDRKWRAANIEKARAATKAYAARHPERKRARCANRKARKRAQTCGDRSALAAYYRWVKTAERLRCSYCAEIVPQCEREVDHIVPIARGGAHSVGNLCVSCGPCNRKKNAKTADEFRGREATP